MESWKCFIHIYKVQLNTIILAIHVWQNILSDCRLYGFSTDSVQPDSIYMYI